MRAKMWKRDGEAANVNDVWISRCVAVAYRGEIGGERRDEKKDDDGVLRSPEAKGESHRSPTRDALPLAPAVLLHIHRLRGLVPILRTQRHLPFALS